MNFMENTKKHQYSDEDGDGNIIWIDYNPKKHKPESDTRVVEDIEIMNVNKIKP